MKKYTHKEMILNALRFRPYFTTELFLKLVDDGEQIGVKSLTSRLADLAKESKIIGEEVTDRKEKRWRLNNGELF